MKLNEALVFDGVENAPQQFQSMINKIARKLDASMFGDVELEDGDAVIRFGDPALPTEKNTVHIGGKFFNKSAQYQKLEGVVPTIKTYEEYVDDIGDNFIAKKKAGQKQQGQLDSKLPEDSSDFVFQPKVTIVKEYRINVFYMNGSYHVAGIYEKTGSNVSFKSISLSGSSKILVDIAIKATKALKYGFAGCDVALVGAEDLGSINESVLGKVSQIMGRAAGKLSDTKKLLETHYPVVIEVNSFPSMNSPMIAADMFDAIQDSVL